MNYNKIYYRDNGAVGALLDEYERSIKDLKHVLKGVTNGELIAIVDVGDKSNVFLVN